ncbi:MAG: DUF3261 domain-containing protein [Halofilum sp. (in: g-proteobacteria)]|nr:DUF3261 domain-containing protein [Halofilum sp. (in: g-proteobacteria)]
MPARLSALRRLVVLPLLLLTACSLSGAGHPPERALAPPSALGDRSFQQVLTIHADGTVRRLIAAGQIRDGVLVLALLTPEGVELLRMRQDSDGLVVRRERDLPPGMTPRAIVADFQLIHWPASALRVEWGRSWDLTERSRERVLAYRGEPRVRVAYADRPWHGAVTLEHLQYGYRLEVKTLSHDRRARGDAPVDGE